MWVRSCEVSGWICALLPLLSEEWSCLSAMLQAQDKTLISSSFSLLLSLWPLPTSLKSASNSVALISGCSSAQPQLSSTSVRSFFVMFSSHSCSWEQGNSRCSGHNTSLAEGNPSPPRIPWERWWWSWLCVICMRLFCWPGRRDGNRPARHHVRTWHLHRGSN